MARKMNNIPKHDRNIDAMRQAGKKPYLDDSKHGDNFFSQFRDIFSFSPRLSLNDSGVTTAEKVVAISLIASIAAVGAFAYNEYMHDMKKTEARTLTPYEKEYSCFGCGIPDRTDCDDDGLKNEDEKIFYKTDFNNPDTDGDHIWDGEEINVLKTDPLKKDTDGDGIDDFNEAKVYGTDPNNPDDGGYYNAFISNKRNPGLKAKDMGRKIASAIVSAPSYGMRCSAMGYKLFRPCSDFPLYAILEHSENDPMIKYYAGKTEIIMPDGNQTGKIMVDGKPLLKALIQKDDFVFPENNLEKGKIITPSMEIIEGAGDEIDHISNPSYFLTEGNRTSNIRDCAVAAVALLKEKGYSPNLKIENGGGYKCSIWVEFQKNNKTYAISGNDVYTLEDFRKISFS